MSESQDRTLPATPRRRESARNKGLAPNATALGWPAMAAVVLAVMPVWYRTTASATVSAIENIQMTGKGGSSYELLPIIFPTVVVVMLALGVLIMVRTPPPTIRNLPEGFLAENRVSSQRIWMRIRQCESP